MGKPQFAPVPCRAIGDRALTDGDLRVLAAVSAYDRLSQPKGKGQGAWVAHKTMAAWIERNYSNFSTTISKLIRLGYLVRESRQGDRRQFTYRVVYTDEDRVPSSKDVCPEAKEAAEIVCPEAKAADEIVCLGSGENPRNSATWQSEYISRREEIDPAKAGEINSTEVAHPGDARFRPDGELTAAALGIDLRASKGKETAEAGLGRMALAAHLPPNFTRLPLGAQVSGLDRAYTKLGREPGRLQDAERATLTDWLGEIFDEHMGGEWDAVAQQAGRLREDMLAW